MPKKSPKQLNREISATLAKNAPRYYVAHPDSIDEVTIVFRGLGDFNTKRHYKKPVRVRNVSDGDEFFVEESELFRDPAAAGVRSAKLASALIESPSAKPVSAPAKRGGAPTWKQIAEDYKLRAAAAKKAGGKVVRAHGSILVVPTAGSDEYFFQDWQADELIEKTKLSEKEVLKYISIEDLLLAQSQGW